MGMVRHGGFRGIDGQYDEKASRRFEAVDRDPVDGKPLCHHLADDRQSIPNIQMLALGPPEALHDVSASFHATKYSISDISYRNIFTNCLTMTHSAPASYFKTTAYRQACKLQLSTRSGRSSMLQGGTHEHACVEESWRRPDRHRDRHHAWRMRRR